MSWFFDAKNAGLVGGWGLILSIVGTLLTLAGLLWTGLQAGEAVTAAKAAQEASEATRDRALKFRIVSDISEASAALNESLTHIKNKAWGDASTGLLRADAALASVLVLERNLTPAHKTVLEEMSVALSAARKRLRATGGKGAGALAPDATILVIEEFSVKISAVRAQVERKSFDEKI